MIKMNNLATQDLQAIAEFHKTVKNYLKMKALSKSK